MTLRQLRKERGLTQEQLADLSGIEQETISAIEVGKTRQPRASTMNALAVALDLSPSDFRDALARTEAA
jgi:transcriptional regulator with XRE-family HTH domain